MFSDKTLILNRLKFALKCKTSADLAKYLGIAPNTLTNWYKRNTIDYDLVFSKCEHMSIDWLLTGTGSMLRNAVYDMPSGQVDPNCSKCADYVDKIRDLQYIIDVQHQLIEELKLKGEDCQLGAGNASVADVG